jgi:hypothetical protein
LRDSRLRHLEALAEEGGNISRGRQFYSLEVPILAIVIWQSGK